jgi:hypothetical protein
MSKKVSIALSLKSPAIVMLIVVPTTVQAYFSSWELTIGATLAALVVWSVSVVSYRKFKGRDFRAFLRQVGKAHEHSNESAPYKMGYAVYKGIHQFVGITQLPEGIFVGATFCCNILILWDEIRNIRVLDTGEHIELVLKKHPMNKLILPWGANFFIPEDVWAV